MTQRNKLLKLLQKSEELSDGKLGTWKTDLVEFKLKEYEKPTWSRPYPVTQVPEEMFKKEVEGLVLLGVVEVEDDSEWGALSFALPKPKSNQVSFIS